MSSGFGGIVEGTTVGVQREVTLDSSYNDKKKLSDGAANAPAKKKVIQQEETKVVDNMKAKIDLKYAFGSSGTSFDGVLTYAAVHGGDKESSDRLIYRVGKQICVLDPENGNQLFFSGRSRNVTNVLHFSISPNQKCICMCESTREEGALDVSNNGIAQLSVYSLVSFTKLKTLYHPSQSEFISASFCGDPKYVTALTGDIDKQIIVWQWEKDKLHKSVNINLPVTRLRAAPCNSLMLTTSGPGILKSWFIGPDGQFRSTPLLPPIKESENFIDHCWLHLMIGGAIHKMVAITDPDTSGTYTNIFSVLTLLYFLYLLPSISYCLQIVIILFDFHLFCFFEFLFVIYFIVCCILVKIIYTSHLH